MTTVEEGRDREERDGPARPNNCCCWPRAVSYDIHVARRYRPGKGAPEDTITLSPDCGRDSAMLPHNITIHPEQLAALTKTFQEYCREARVEAGTPEYRDAGHFLIFLYQHGILDQDKLARALRARTNPPVQ
jgi:hypothetical protein